MNQPIKRGLSILLTAAMMLTMIPFGIAASAQENEFDVPDDYTLSPISTVDQLSGIATGKAAAKAYYYLTNDISIETDTFKGIGSNENTDAFWDIFDGNGYTITFAGPDGKGVALNGSGTWNGGLFFAINGDAVIKNLTLKGAVTSTAQSTGALVGQMMSGTIDRCVNRASVTAAGKEGIGGFVGRLKQGIVVNCMNYGSITGGNFVGGLVGKVAYSDKGVNAASIANSANFGSIKGKDKVGGIIGLAQMDLTYTVENCYNAGQVTGETLLTQGAIVCSAWPGAVKTVNCYALDTSCTKFLNATTKMSAGDMQAVAFAETLNANVTAGIVFADGVANTEVALPAVAWQYNEGGYPTIPMVEPVNPPKELTPEEQMDLIRLRLTEDFLKNDAVHSSGAHNGICYISKAGEYLDLQQQDGSWDDVDYYCTQSAANGGVWEPYLALDRMLAMAYAWAKPDGEWYHNEEMQQGVNNAFTYWASIRDANPEKDDYEGPWSTNWWENGNGVQRRFGPIGVVMKDGLTQESIGVILRKLNKDGDTGSGANALWNTQNALYRGLTAGDSAQFKKVVEKNLAVNLRVGGLTDEAIQVDNTFHCHGYQLYTNGYGKSLFSDMAWWIGLLAGTDYAMPQHVLDLMADYMLGGTRWMIRGNLLEMADGYKGSGDSGYIEPLQRMVKNDPKNAAEYQKVLDSITGASGTTYNGANGNNYMWTSALMSQMREGYGVNVRMNNKGMKSTEWRATWPKTDFGNLIFWTADGTASIMIDGDEYNSVYDTYDWRHVPGVTAPFALATHYGFDNDSNDCWGVSNGTYGATAYTFNKHDGTNKRTQGKIGYFFFDDEYVALGAGIRANHEQAIHTTVNQTKAADVSVNGAAVADGTDEGTYQADYVYNNQIGYVFPEQTDVVVSNLNHTPKKYPTVRGNGYSDLSEDRFGETEESTFSLWIDHGVQPQDASYSYIVVPNTNEQELAAYSKSNPITIITNTEKVQAVRHETLKQTQINFYEAGTLQYAPGKTVSVDGPCSLIIDESGREPVISQAVSNTRPNTLVNVVLTTGDANTVTEFCSLSEPYAGKPITQAAGGSSLIQSSSTSSEHSAARAFDKNLETYWESEASPSWISYDMREDVYVGSMTVRWGEAYATKYELQYSEDGVNWQTAYTQENGKGGTETVPFNTISRYWRLWCTESSGDRYQIKEIVFQTSRNLATNKPVTASTSADGKQADYAVDGDMSTRWVGSRGVKDSWIVADLGMNTRMDGVRIMWEASYASKYTIDVSDDGETWKTAAAVTSPAVSGEKIVTVQTALPQGTTGQYLRIKGVEMALPQYGLSIWELEIYGGLQMDSDNVAAGKPVLDAAGQSAAAAADGKTDTVWSTDQGTDSLTVDLGETHQVDSVSVVWGERNAADYVWQVSFNGKTWSDAAAVTAGIGGTETAVIATNARYVRLQMNRSASSGYDVAEIEIYGTALADMNPDKAALKKAIDTPVRGDVYTQATYSNYQNALAVATNVHASPKATQKMVDEALADLQTALDKLTFRNFGTVLATIPGQTVSCGSRQVLGVDWKAFSQKLNLSGEDLDKIYLFATVDITRDPDREETGMFGNGQIRIRSTAASGENSVFINTNTQNFHLGRTVLYFPLSEMKTISGTMDWSKVEAFRMYIDSVNKFEGNMTMTLSDVQLIRTTETRKVKVACVGDSITAGSGASAAGNNYVSQLQKQLGTHYTVQNFGNSGKTLLAEGADNSGYTKTDTYTNSKAFEPDVVTIMLGTNDSKDATWNAYGDKYEQELRELVQTYRDLPSHPLVILATSPTAYNRNWNINDAVVSGKIAPIQRKVAAEMGCPLIDANAATKNAADKFADGIHPNDAGHALLAELFAKDIRDAMASIYSFTLAGADGVIDAENGRIAVALPQGTDLTGLTPVIETAFGATVSPAGAADFTSPVTYTVTAPDETTTKEYVVTVSRSADVVKKADLKKALDEKITDLTPYTAKTAADYTKALEAAQMVYDDLKATQAQVDKALADLNAAKTDLKKKADKADLKEAAGESLDLTLYTAETAAAYTKALEAAQTVLDNPDAEQAAVDKALADLREAKKRLVLDTVGMGDLDGDGHVTAADALMALQAATNKITLDEKQKVAADVDGKDGVTATDALLILQFATRKISSFK